MNSGKLLAIGEALIDFIPAQTGCAFEDVQSFSPAVGGAPANVCGAFTRLGGDAELLTQLGDDPFGHKIASELSGFGIGVQHIHFTQEANTALAFVSLGTDGNRTFSFYRKPSADMLYPASLVRAAWFENAFALHFCSVSLGDFPMKEAHRTAIGYALDAGALISFDPNLRLPLWDDPETLRAVTREFCPLAHILKISDEELEFITGTCDIEAALPLLLTGRTELVVYTRGGDGAMAFTKAARAESPALTVKPVDTTGAGDAFIGAFLYQMHKLGATPSTLRSLPAQQLAKALGFANRYCARSIQKHGAICSYPSAAEMQE